MVYRYMSCKQCRCIVPAHYTHSVIHIVSTNQMSVAEPYWMGEEQAEQIGNVIAMVGRCKLTLD